MFVGKLSEWQKAWSTAQKEGVVGNTVPHENKPFIRFYNVYRTKGKFPGIVYRVTWWKGSVPFIQCTCQAGQNGTRCKHAAWVLATHLYPHNFDREPQVDIVPADVTERGKNLLLKGG